MTDVRSISMPVALSTGGVAVPASAQLKSSAMPLASSPPQRHTVFAPHHDPDIAMLEPPSEPSGRDASEVRARTSALVEIVSGDPVELANQLAARTRTVQQTTAENSQRANALKAERELAKQEKALARAREAAEGGGFWDKLATVGAIVSAAVGVLGAAFTGGASLALAGLAIGCALGAKYSGEIAKAFCKAVGMDPADAKWVALGLSALFIAGSVATGVGAASAGGATASATVQTIKATAQVVNTAAQVTTAAGKTGHAVCEYRSAMAHVDAEKAGTRADWAQEARDDDIESLKSLVKVQAREGARVSEMQRLAHESRMMMSGQRPA